MILKIDQVNWPEQYPEAPETIVTLSHDDTRLIVRYDVKGRQLRAEAVEDMGEVWKDSCVEFFCMLPDGERYINFETNCIGTILASRRKGRSEDVKPLSADELKSITRTTSLPHERIPEKDGMFSWTVEIGIPLRILTGEDRPAFPLTLRGNFYKCADDTRYPHFLSWKRIPLPKPDFHRPEFFGEITVD